MYRMEAVHTLPNVAELWYGAGYGSLKGNGAEVKIMAKTVKFLTITECNGGVADWDLWMDGISDVPCWDGR